MPSAWPTTFRPGAVTVSPSGRWLTVTSLIALVLGFGLGVVAEHSPQSWETYTRVLTLAGKVWVTALALVIIPLVLAQIMLVVLRAGEGQAGAIGLLGAKTVLSFLAMLVLAGLFALVTTPLLLTLYQVDPLVVAGIRSSIVVPPAALDAARGIATDGPWWSALNPARLFQARSGTGVLLLLIAGLGLAVGVRSLVPRWSGPVLRACEAVGAATRFLIGWLLKVLPLAIFALMFVLAGRLGLRAAGFIIVFLVLVCGLLFTFTAILYPLTAAVGKVSLRRFARAAGPAQLVAVSTRSSVAALPALVDGAQHQLGLPPAATGFVLPLAVSVFKLNRTISATVELLFLAHVFGVSIGAGQLVASLGLLMLQSFSTPGMPGGGTPFRTLPIYLAAGLPIEGIVILEAVDAIPDIFKTLLNVTGDLSVATMLTRSSRVEVAG